MKDFRAYTLTFVEPTLHEKASSTIVRVFEDAGFTWEREDDKELQFLSYDASLDAVCKRLDTCADAFDYIAKCDTESYTFGV